MGSYPVTHTFSGDQWFEEEQRMERALLAGGYAKMDHLELCGPAMQALVGDLHEIAVEQGIWTYEVSAARTEKGDLEVTFVFTTVADAMIFKMALP